MPLKSFVKVSHLSNLSDARYCAGMGADVLGFAAVPDAPHYLTPQVFQDIRGWVAGPQIAAEIYGVKTPAEIESVIRDYSPDYLELTLTEYERFADAIRLPCIVSVDDLSRIKVHQKKSGITYIIAENGMNCDEILTIPYRVLVRVPSVERLHGLLAENCAQGFVLEGPKETRPGYTNFDAFGDILEALQEDA